jgi:hypothetical protein
MGINEWVNLGLMIEDMHGVVNRVAFAIKRQTARALRAVGEAADARGATKRGAA